MGVRVAPHTANSRL